MKNHPLFPDKPEADVLKIRVQRFQNGQKFDAPQAHAAEELLEPMQIFDRYGGGLYELIAHGKTGEGKHSGIVARQEFRFEGPSKPFMPGGTGEVPAAVQAIPVPSGAAPGGDVLTLLLGLVTNMMNMMLQIATRPAPVAAPAAPDGTLELMRSMAAQQLEILKLALANHQRPATEGAPGVAGGLDQALESVLKVLKVGTDLRSGALEGATEALKASGAGGAAELNPEGFMKAAREAVGMIKDVAAMAKNGATPEQAAESVAASVGAG